MLSLHIVPPAKGPHLQGIYYTCSTAKATDWRQSGVLQGPTVQLRIGLKFAPRKIPISVPTAADDTNPHFLRRHRRRKWLIGFIRSGSAPAGGQLRGKLTLR